MVDLCHNVFYFYKKDILLRLILNSCPKNEQISTLSIQVVNVFVSCFCWSYETSGIGASLINWIYMRHPHFNEMDYIDWILSMLLTGK